MISPSKFHSQFLKIEATHYVVTFRSITTDPPFYFFILFFHFPEKVWENNGKNEQSLRESEDNGGNGRRRRRAAGRGIGKQQLLRLYGRFQPQLHLVHHTGLLLRSISAPIGKFNCC